MQTLAQQVADLEEALTRSRLLCQSYKELAERLSKQVNMSTTNPPDGTEGIFIDERDG